MIIAIDERMQSARDKKRRDLVGNGTGTGRAKGRSAKLKSKTGTKKGGRQREQQNSAVKAVETCGVSRLDNENAASNNRNDDDGREQMQRTVARENN